MEARRYGCELARAAATFRKKDKEKLKIGESKTGDTAQKQWTVTHRHDRKPKIRLGSLTLLCPTCTKKSKEKENE